MNYLVTGLREGFRIGFDYGTHQCRKSGDNMRSAQQHPQVVRNYVLKECEAGRLLGPFDPQMSMSADLGSSPKQTQVAGD